MRIRELGSDEKTKIFMVRNDCIAKFYNRTSLLLENLGWNEVKENEITKNYCMGANKNILI